MVNVYYFAALTFLVTLRAEGVGDDVQLTSRMSQIEPGLVWSFLGGFFRLKNESHSAHISLVPTVLSDEREEEEV